MLAIRMRFPYEPHADAFFCWLGAVIGGWQGGRSPNVGPGKRSDRRQWRKKGAQFTLNAR